MGSPHALEFVSSVWEEHVVSSNYSWDVVRSSSGNHSGIVAIVSEEHLLEFTNAKSSISRLIVSGDHELTLIKSWVNANGIESLLELMNINGSISWNVEDSESINNVEVLLVSKLDLGVLNFLFKVANLLQGVNELILLVEREDWFS